MGLATLLLVTSFIVGSIAGPLSQFPENQCATTCTENKKFQYEVDKAYIYQYEASTQTELISNIKEASGLLIKATAEVQVVSKCNLILKLRDVEIRSPGKNRLLSGNNEFKTALEANNLDFSFQDGAIEALCPRSQEPAWVLNFKRGILSMFQNTMSSLDTDHNTEETDITGKCATSYNVVTSGRWLADTVVSKSKDLLKCTDRSGHYTWIQSAPRQLSPIIPQSSPLIKSSHGCQQTIRQNIIQKADCQESHRFQPFESENSGATTNIRQTLVFKNASPISSQSSDKPVASRTSLLFDHEYKKPEVDQQVVRDVLTQLCKASENEIKPEVPKLFFQFVNSLKGLSYEQLENLYNNGEACRNTEKTKKLFMDAVPLVGTAASVQFMSRHISKSASQSDGDKWLTALSLLPNPTKEVLQSALPLLDLEGHRSKALFAVSALTHSFCKNRIECGGVTEVVNVVQNIVSQIPQDCQTKDESSIERVLSLLKALGNIGFIDQAIPILQTCYENAQNTIEVRLAAIDAHRRVPCSKQPRGMLTTFLNREEDSEIRIGAYLVVMKCPTQNILDQIEESLLTEEVNQVGSFVWTHMTALKNSQNPNKMMVKEILTSKKLQKKFSTDVRKFSRYYEGSIYLSSIRTGAHVDGSVIFSPKSYLPRSANLGLNMDIFGESIDLIEIGGRLEGFEQLVESIFGTEGYFPDDTIHHMLESYRNKKSSDNHKLNEIAKIFNIKNAKPEEPRGSFYARIFGNEIQAVNFKGLDELVQRAKNSFVYMDKLKKLMSGEDIDFTDNVMLVDTSVTIPTCIGLPLELKVNGTASLKLQMGGKLDTTQLQSKSLTIKGHIRPSAAVEIDGIMMVNGYVARSGLKISTLVHTSTETEGELIVKDGQTVKSQIKLPKDKMEIFDIKSSLFIVDDESEREVQSELPIHHRKCTGDSVSTYLGLELCGEVTYPSNDANAPMISSGPISSRIYLQKTDKLLTTYDFEYRWSKEAVNTKSGQTKYMRIGKLSLDTHKSAVNRELTAEFVYNEADETVSLRLVSPIKKATFNGKLINDPDHKKIDALVLIDDNECLAFLSELRIEADGNNFRWTPSMVIRLNSQPVVSLKGTALTQDKKKYSVDFTVEHLTEQPISISGLASKTSRNGNQRYDVDFNIKSSFLQTFGKWFLNSEATSAATKATIDYKWSTNPKQSLTFSGKSMLSQQNPAAKKLSVEAEFQWTLYPMYNWVMNADMQRNKEQVDNSFTLYYGSEQKSSNMLRIQHSYRGHEYWPKHHLATTLRVVFPPADIDTTIEMKSDLTQKNLDTSFLVQWTPNKKMTLTTSIKRGDESRKQLFSGYTRLTYPENELEVSGCVSQPETDSLVISATGKWAKDTNASVTVTIRNHGPKVPKSWGKEMTIEIRLPEQQPLVFTTDILINDKERSTHGQAEINGQTYKSYAEYLRSSPENLMIKAGVESPTTTYSATTDMQLQDEDRRVSTEILLGSDRRVKTDVQLKNDGNSRNMYASLLTDADNHPNDIYSLQLTLQNIIQGSEGEVTLRIPPDTEYGLEWKSKKDGSFGSGTASVIGQYSAWWAPGRKVIADISLKTTILSSSREVAGTITIDTPWSKDLKMSATHKDNGQRFSSKVDIRYEKDPVLAVSADGAYAVENDLQKITSTFRVSTWGPIVRVKLDHQWNRATLKTLVIVNTDQENEFRLNFLGLNKRTPDKLELSGVDLFLEVNTPYESFKKLSLGTNFTLDLPKIELQSLVGWNDDEYTADYESHFERNANNEISHAGHIRVTTPIKNVPSIRTQWTVSVANSVLNSGVSIAWSPYEKITLDLSANAGTRVGSIHFTSPFRNFENIQLAGSVMSDASRPNLKLKLKYEEKSAQLNLEWTPAYSMNNFYYKLNVEQTLFEQGNEFGTEVSINAQPNRIQGSITAFVMDQTAMLKLVLSRPNHDENITKSWSAQFLVKTPLERLSNLNLTIAHDRVRDREASHIECNSHVEGAINNEVVSIKQTYRLINEQGIAALVIHLPFESLHTIELRVNSSHAFRHEMHIMQLSWSPGQTLKLKHTLDMENGNVRLKQTFWYTPRNQATQINLFEVITDFNLMSTIYNADGGLQINYREEQVLEAKLLFSRSAEQATGSGRLTLSLPTTPLKTISTAVQYDLTKPNKINAILEIETPFENYKSNKLAFDFDYENIVGELDLTMDGRSLTVLLESQISANRTYYVIRLKTPLDGFKTMSLATDVDLSDSQNLRASIIGDGDLGKIQLETFYRKTNTINVGAIFTSTIPDYESFKFDYLGDTGLHKISIFRGRYLDITSTLAYNINPSNGFVKVTWQKTSVDAKWTYVSGRSVDFNLAHTIDDAKTEFSYVYQQKSADSALISVTLKTPSDTLKEASFNGKYSLSPSDNQISLNIKYNDNFKMNLDGEINVIPRSNEYRGKISLKSTIPDYELITAEVNLASRPEKKLETSVLLNGNTFISFKGMLSQSATSLKSDCQLTFNKFANIRFLIDYQNEAGQPLRFISSVTFNQRTTSLKVDYHSPSRGAYNFKGEINLPTDNYSPIISTIKLVVVPNAKLEFDTVLSVRKSNRLEKYQLAAEYDDTHSGYLECSLKFVSPTEESRVYLNYNVQGVHNITYDLKLTKGKTMMESRARIYVNPDWTRAQGSLAFNTNYKSLISANYNGMYESKVNVKEMSLQSNINGVNNELMATLTKRDNDIEVDVHGETNRPEAQKFSLRGWIKGQVSNREVQLTLTRNDDVFGIRGQLTEQSGKLTITTPYFLKQSIEVLYEIQRESFVVTVTNDSERLLQVTLNHKQSSVENEISLKIDSSFPTVSKISSRLVYSFNLPSEYARFQFNSDSFTIASKLERLSTRYSDEMSFEISSNVDLPLINMKDLQSRVSYNTGLPTIEAVITASSKTLLQLKVTLDSGRLYVIFDVPNYGKMEIKGSNQSRYPKTYQGEFMIYVDGFWLEKMSLETIYAIPKISLKITKGKKTIEFKTDVDNRAESKLFTAAFKSPFINFEDVSLYASLKDSTTFELNGKLSPSQHFNLKCLYNPEAGLEKDLVSVVVSSSMNGYEDLKLVVKKSHITKSVGISFSNKDKDISFTAYYSKNVAINFRNSFTKTFRDVKLNFNWEINSVSLKFELDESKVLEIIGQFELALLKSSWAVSIRNDFYRQTSNRIRSSYNIATKDNYSLMLAAEIDSLSILDVNLAYTSGRFDMTLKSHLEKVSLFRVQTVVKSDTGKEEASLEVQINDKRWASTGTLSKNSDGYTVQVENVLPVGNFGTNINVVSTPTKKLLGGELNMNGKRLGSVQGTIEINIPESISGGLQIDTPWLKSNDFNFQAKVDRSYQNLFAKVQWSPESAIEINGRLYLADTLITVTTPFRYFAKMSFSAQVKSLSSNRVSVKSMIRYRDEPLAGFNFNYANTGFGTLQARNNAEAAQLLVTLDLTSPTIDYHSPSFYFKLAKKSQERLNVDATLRVKLEEVNYGFEGNCKFDYDNNFNGVITFTTPFKSLETAKFEVQVNKKDAKTFDAIATLTLPTGKHILRSNCVISPSSIDFEVHFSSTQLPTMPISLIYSYSPTLFKVELNIASVKRYIKWSHEIQALKNGHVVIATETPSAKSGYEWMYKVDVSEMSAKLDMRNINSPAGRTLASVNYKGERGLRSMEVAVTLMSEELVTFNYKFESRSFKTLLKLSKPLTPTTVVLDLSLSKEDGALLLTVNNVQNYIKGSLQVNENQLNAQLRTEVPIFGISYTKIEFTNKRTGISKEFSTSLATRDKIYKIVGELALQNGECKASATLTYPGHKIEVTSGGFFRGLRNMKAAGTVVVDGQKYLASISVTSDSRTGYTSNLLIDAPFMSTVSVNTQVRISPNIEAKVEVTFDEITHKGELKIDKNSRETNIEIVLESPKLDIKSVNVRSSNENDRSSNSVIVKTTGASHSVLWEGMQDSKTKKMRLTADTPYLKDGKYTLAGEKSRNGMSMSLNTPTYRHSIVINVFKASNGDHTVKLTINCPFMIEDQIQLIGTLSKFDRSSLVGSLELIKAQTVHKVNADLQLRGRTFSYDVSLRTPVYNIQYVESQGKLSIPNDRSLVVDVTYKRNQNTYTMKGDFKLTNDEINGQLKVQSPIYPPVDITAKGSWAKPGSFETSATIQTPTTTHTLALSLQANNGTFGIVFRVNSPVLPGESLTLNGSVILNSPTLMSGQLSMENPGNTFKVSSEYRSEPESNRRVSNLVIITPFEIAPYIKLSGQWARDAKLMEGELEIYTVEKLEPDFGLNIRLQCSEQRLLSGSVNVKTTIKNFQNIHFKYEAPVNGRAAAVLSHDKTAYGYEYQSGFPLGQRNINVAIFWGSRKSTLGLEITRRQMHYSFKSEIDSGFGNTPITLQYETDVSSQGKTMILAAVTIGYRARYMAKVEYSCQSERFDGELTFTSPLIGYEDITVSLMKSFTRDEQNVLFQWLSDKKIRWEFKLNSTAIGSEKGKGQIGLKTPTNLLDANYDINYEWDGKNTLRASIVKDDIKLLTVAAKYLREIQVQYLSQIRPMTFTYTFEPKPTNNDFKIVVSVTDNNKFPLTFTVLKQSSSSKVYVYLTKLAWGEGTNKQLILSTDVDLQEPNYKLVLGATHSTRTVRLNVFYSTPQAGGTQAMVNLKWDAGNDQSKTIGFNYKQQLIDSEQRSEIGLIYPGIEKMSILSRTSTDDKVLEVVYGAKPHEKITLEIKTKDDTFDFRVRNAETNLDVHLTTQCKCTDEQYSARASFSYLDSRNKQQKLDVELVAPKNQPQLTFKASTSESKMVLTGKINSNSDGYGLVIEHQFDDEQQSKMEMSFKRLEGHKGVVIFNDFGPNSGSFSMSAGMPDSKTIRLSSNKSVKDQSVNYLDLCLNLHQPRELQTRFSWKSEVIREIQENAKSLITDTSSKIVLFLKATKTAGSEIMSKSQLVLRAILKNAKPINFSTEWKALVADYEPLITIFNKMYEQDIYFIKTLAEQIGEITIDDKIMQYVAQACDYMCQSTSWISSLSFGSSLDYIRAGFQSLSQKWIQMTGKQIQRMPIALLNSIDEIHQWGTKFLNNVVIASVRSIKNLLINWIPPVKEWKNLAPEWTRHVSAAVSDQISDYLNEFSKSKYFQQLEQSVHQLKMVVSNIYSSKLWSKAKMYYNYVDDQIDDQIKTLKSYAWFQDLEIFSEKSYALGKWAYKFLRVQDIVKQFADSIIARAEDVVISVIADTLLPQYQLPSMTTNIAFAPELGLMEINQTLPVSWTSFTQLPDVYGSPEYKQLAQFQKDLLQLPKTSAKKLYNAFKSEFSWKTVSPAFRATAILAGNQHYTTFDGKTYEFSGACSYLLANDFAGQKFTLIVNYQLESNNVDEERVAVKSFTLNLGPTKTIEIRPDLSVTINNVAIETPLKVESTIITRTDDVLSVIDEHNKIFLTYYRKYDILKFEMSGFYHGKTGGLFGTYDHEPNTDLLVPSQQKASSLERFGSSWEISPNECKNHKNFAYHSDVNSYNIQKTCKQTFNDHSLSSCSIKMNKEPYVNMCVNDASLGLSPCNSAAAYILKCHAEGYDAEMPESCMECEIGGSKIPQAQQVKLSESSIPKSADVVFVLDNTWQCSTTFPNLRRTVATVARSVEQALTKKKVPLINNRYALVGLAGADVSSSPQAFTVNGQIFNSVQYIRQAVNNTSFSAGHHHHISEIIEYAHDLPFRAGVAKILIVLPCSESVDNEGEYDALTEKLENANTIVHIVSIHDATVNEPNKVKSSDVVGFDAGFAYTLKSIQRGSLVGNKELRSQLTVPKNPLVTMAIETDGSVFFASKLASSHSVTSSRANEAFSLRVADNSTPAKCQNCLCTVGQDGMPKTVCSNCS